MSSSPVQVDPSPFDLGGETRAAALCLHGLTGTPYEVRPLGEAMAASGIRAVGPWNPGHDTTPEDLAGTTYEQWVEAAREHFRKLRERHERVFIVGMSMGGLLALTLAAEEEVDALVVVGTPLRLSWPITLSVPLLKYLRPFLEKSGGSDIRDDAARARHPGYKQMPLASVHELLHLQRRVQHGLKRVSAPILVAHGALDKTANPANAREIFDCVSSAVKEISILEASGHVCPVDIDGPTLAAATAEFLTRFV